MAMMVMMALNRKISIKNPITNLLLHRREVIIELNWILCFFYFALLAEQYWLVHLELSSVIMVEHHQPPPQPSPSTGLGGIREEDHCEKNWRTRRPEWVDLPPAGLQANRRPCINHPIQPTRLTRPLVRSTWRLHSSSSPTSSSSLLAKTSLFISSLITYLPLFILIAALGGPGSTVWASSSSDRQANGPPRFKSDSSDFDSQSEIVVRVREGQSSLNKEIYHLIGEDPDGDPLQFGVLGTLGRDLLRIESVGKEEAKIYLRKELDREIQDSYTLVLTLTDGKLGKGNFVSFHPENLSRLFERVSLFVCLYPDHQIVVAHCGGHQR